MEGTLLLLVNVATLATMVIGLGAMLRKSGAKSQSVIDAEASIRKDNSALSAQIASLAKTVTDLTLITTRGEMTDSRCLSWLEDIEKRVRKIELNYHRKSDPMTDTPG